MDALKFAAGLATGDSSILKHDNGAYLVKEPGGFDPETGAKNPPVERGLLKADIDAARTAAEKAVEQAQAALAKAQAALDAFDTVDAEIAKADAAPELKAE